LKISRITKLLDEELEEQSNYVFDVVVYNRTVKTEEQLQAVKKGLDVIQNYFGLSYQTPASIVLQAVNQSA
jgi:hypothetical protein